MTHVTIERAKFEQVLEALESCDQVYGSEGSHQYFSQAMVDKAITVAKQALEQPVQEPRPSFADVVRAEPTELIQKWRVLELYRAYEHCQFQATPPAQPAPVPTNCRHCGGPDNVLCGGQCKAAQPAPVTTREIDT